jgi:16S rRNA (uracil1498-N3)-methyltransferase
VPHPNGGTRRVPTATMSDRYFVDSPIASDRAVLAGAEAHHVLHVMRAGPGARVTLFDGTGWEFEAAVHRAGRAEVELAILSRQEVDREAATALTLGVALPKGDRQKWLVEKATELGVARLVPLTTQRAVAQPGESALERLRRAVIEASKQCGRNRLMEIGTPRAWDEFLTEGQPSDCRVVAHPGTSERWSPAAYARVAAAVGPEGGFTDEEIAQAAALGWKEIGLGPRILRVETAAIALAALCTSGFPA